MQRRFQIGDKVRVLSCYAGDSRHAGKVGIVTGHDEDGDHRVDLGGPSHCVATRVENFEHAKPSSATRTMRKVKTLARKLLDKDTQSLIEAGVLSDDLSVRDSEFVLSFLINQHKKELAIEARAKIKAEKDDEDY